MFNTKHITLIALVAMIALVGFASATPSPNYYFGKNVQLGGGTQYIVHSQTGSGMSQFLVNYNAGGYATQTIVASQSGGSGNVQIAVNYNTGGSGCTQTITSVQG